MTLVVITGGSRSGKSRTAIEIALRQPQPVHFLATAEARDEEMARRIARHRDERPASWTTIEEPVLLAPALSRVPSEHCLVIDCLTLWTSNALETLSPVEVEQQSRDAARLAKDRVGRTIVVTNEVGLGVVPDNPLARTYVDLLGRVNTSWAEVADRMILMVAGRIVPLAPRTSVEGYLDDLAH